MFVITKLNAFKTIKIDINRKLLLTIFINFAIILVDINIVRYNKYLQLV